MNGYIKLNRQIVNWEWYLDFPTKMLFIHLLVSATHKEVKHKGGVLGPAQIITTLPNLSEQTGLSIQQIRRAIINLKSTGEITDKTTNKNRLITINNWTLYQLDDIQSNRQNNSQTTDKQQTNNRQYIEQECKECKEEKLESKEERKKSKETNKQIKKVNKQVYGEYKNVLLTEEEYQKLSYDYSNVEDLITFLDEYIEEKGYKSKSHYLAIKRWVVKALERREDTSSLTNYNEFHEWLEEEQKKETHKDGDW